MANKSDMRAWVFKSSGQPEKVLHLEEHWPVPKPTGKEVLVKVEALALNPVGWKTMGVFPMSLLMKKPAVPEADVSGTVVGGTLDGTGFSIGDEVFGMIPYSTVMKKGCGTLAEYAAVDPATLVKKPANISHAEAASFPLAGLTAYLALTKNGGLKRGAGQRVFVNGASGGVGAYAVQIAKEYGAHVTTTCSPGSKSFVEALHPYEIIDYHSVNLANHLKENYSSKEKQFDICFDSIGVSALYAASPAYLKPNTAFLDIAGPPLKGAASVPGLVSALANRLIRPRILGGTPVKYKFLMLNAESMGPELQEAADLLRDGKIKAKIDKVFKFDDAIAAYERSISGRAQGKVVIEVV